MELLFAYIKSHEYGNGHFSRIINLKKKIPFKKKIKILNIAKKKDRISFLKISKSKKIKILLDISNKKFLKTYKNYLKKIQSNLIESENDLIIIDDVGSNSILHSLNKCNIKFYINPYINSLNKKKLIKNSFLGENYLIGLNQYPLFYQRKKKTKNILVFLTASKNVINFKLANYIKREYNFFSKFNISFISADYLDLKKKIDLKFLKFYDILKVTKMIKFLKKNDLVISGQGNFKYEIMSTQQPLIIITEKKFYLLIKKRLSKINVINIENLKKLKNFILNSTNRYKRSSKKKVGNQFLKRIFP
tara:strand:- start:913 stop:1827 length:915 start_codon:yes stop_codon:yes gene_type:complete